MQFSTLILGFVALFSTTVLAAPGESIVRDEGATIFERAVNNGRPVATGACCIEATSKKGDTCNNGAAGICAVANTAGCKFS